MPKPGKSPKSFESLGQLWRYLSGGGGVGVVEHSHGVRSGGGEEEAGENHKNADLGVFSVLETVAIFFILKYN